MEIFEQTYYGNTVLQWITALAIIVFTLAIGRIVFWVFKNILRAVAEKTATKFDDIVVDAVERPLLFILSLIGIWWALVSLTLPDLLRGWISNGYDFLVTIAFAWVLARFFDSMVKEYIAPKVAASDTDLDDQLLPILRKGIKATIWIVAIIVGLDNAGYDVAALLAGLGIGGLAFAMAAKDTVSNLFGGFTVFTDKPFTINDRIVVDGTDGTVKEIGVRSTRLQTLEGRTVVIPNAKFADSVIENISSEPSRKITLNLGLTYDMSPEQMEQAMDLLREIATDHSEQIEKKILLSFNAFGDFSLNIMFAYYIKKGAHILDTQTSINLAIYKRFADAGLEFAFPSQTVYHKPVD
ncbi:MAG TPA: mechanosensitive ion channel family protein [Rhodospirillaceae bacterium]|nr:transporter [Rhodospirillaceae bacterium]HAA92763.1 mechanosensitive ion channel family protein [Rhodospirillaceae bacterium]HAT34499.1 mechanosensitive ion channel family protein [Rhodospirillaceae bacterium]